MSMHKLTAGAGYDYLTRQVAALDATEKGHTGLASYYTERGESPGVWIGSGMSDQLAFLAIKAIGDGAVFLSALLCVVGGILGLFLSFGATSLVGYLLDMTMTILPRDIVVSVLVSSIIGIVAGLYPAWKAARLDPIVALQKV